MVYNTLLFSSIEKCNNFSFINGFVQVKQVSIDILEMYVRLLLFLDLVYYNLEK